MSENKEESKVSIHIQFKKIDDRHNKKYGKSCHITLYVSPIRDSSNHKSDEAFRIFYQRIKKCFPTATADSGYNYSSPWYVHLKKFVPAARPSDIVSDTVAREQLPQDQELIIVATLYRDNAEAEWKESSNAEAINRQAGQLLSWFLTKIESEAKTVVRWPQRMAALVAEFKAEVDVQAALKLEEALKEIRKDGQNIPEEVIRQFEINAIEYVKDNKSSGKQDSLFARSIDNGEYLRKKRIKLCPHGNKLGECNACDVAGDLAYETARENGKA